MYYTTPRTTSVLWYDERMEQELQRRYAHASKRLLLLDYDGTLREFEPTPELAVPAPEIKVLLQKLASDSKNAVVIVSGRDHQTLDDWLGDLPVYFVAEHGMAFRAPGQDWQFADMPSTAWQSPVRQAMEESAAAVPGSLVEEKTNSLAWHYRKAGEATAEQTLAVLMAKLEDLAKEYNLRILRGNKVVEVQPVGIDKGASIRRWFDVNAYDFVLAMGDDVTDEDLFRAMPEGAWTIKIGEGGTAAAHRLSDPQVARELLARLAVDG